MKHNSSHGLYVLYFTRRTENSYYDMFSSVKCKGIFKYYTLLLRHISGIVTHTPHWILFGTFLHTSTRFTVPTLAGFVTFLICNVPRIWVTYEVLVHRRDVNVSTSLMRSLLLWAQMRHCSYDCSMTLFQQSTVDLKRFFKSIMNLRKSAPQKNQTSYYFILSYSLSLCC